MMSASIKPAWARFQPAIRHPGRQAVNRGQAWMSGIWMIRTAEGCANAPVAVGISIDP
jgi:hypothetical protein